MTTTFTSEFYTLCTGRRLTPNQKRWEIVERLIKDNVINFLEAIELLEDRVEKEFIYYPPYNPPVFPYPNLPYIQYGTGTTNSTPNFTITATNSSNN